MSGGHFVAKKKAALLKEKACSHARLAVMTKGERQRASRRVRCSSDVNAGRSVVDVGVTVKLFLKTYGWWFGKLTFNNIIMIIIITMLLLKNWENIYYMIGDLVSINALSKTLCWPLPKVSVVKKSHKSKRHISLSKSGEWPHTSEPRYA